MLNEKVESDARESGDEAETSKTTEGVLLEPCQKHG